MGYCFLWLASLKENFSQILKFSILGQTLGGRGYTFNNGVIFQIEKIILLFPLTKACAFFKFIKQRKGGREN